MEWNLLVSSDVFWIFLMGVFCHDSLLTIAFAVASDVAQKVRALHC